MGVEIVGRLVGCRDATLLFSGALANAVALSDLKMNRALSRIGCLGQGAAGLLCRAAPARFAPTRVPDQPAADADISERVRSPAIVWALGFKPDYSLAAPSGFRRESAAFA